MYAYLRGQLVEATPGHATLEINGIGYELPIPVSALAHLPQLGDEVMFYTAWVVREQSHTLYGFLSKEERNLFNALITLSGIGPKTALSLIGHLSLGQVQEAIDLQNATVFARVPGIGKKTAERLLIDLQGKVKLKATSPGSTALHDALQALLQLGYSRDHAEKALKKASSDLADPSDLSKLIAAALKTRV